MKDALVKSLQEILLEHKLRNTTGRMAILRFFLERPHALSYADIEHEFSSRFDRVTVYRTLRTFLDHGVVHKVLDDGGALKYALCPGRCHQELHHHDHIHFKCTMCGETTCLEEANIPSILLPSGYTSNELDLLIRGRCPRCNKGRLQSKKTIRQ
jgi:Fur family ferric uptake transcriptional regulator